MLGDIECAEEATNVICDADSSQSDNDAKVEEENNLQCHTRCNIYHLYIVELLFN